MKPPPPTPQENGSVTPSTAAAAAAAATAVPPLARMSIAACEARRAAPAAAPPRPGGGGRGGEGVDVAGGPAGAGRARGVGGGARGRGRRDGRRHECSERPCEKDVNEPRAHARPLSPGAAPPAACAADRNALEFSGREVYEKSSRPAASNARTRAAAHGEAASSSRRSVNVT